MPFEAKRGNKKHSHYGKEMPFSGMPGKLNTPLLELYLIYFLILLRAKILTTSESNEMRITCQKVDVV